MYQYFVILGNILFFSNLCQIILKGTAENIPCFLCRFTAVLRMDPVHLYTFCINF